MRWSRPSVPARWRTRWPRRRPGRTGHERREGRRVADAPGTNDDRLLLDELTDQLDRTRALLRGDAEAPAELALAHLGARNPREGELVGVLTDRRPLRHPDHFVDAHALVLRSLEVLDRDGWRWPRLPRLWILTTPARDA